MSFTATRRRVPGRRQYHLQQNPHNLYFHGLWPRLLLRRQVIALVNLLVFILLLYHTLYRTYPTRPRISTNSRLELPKTPGYGSIRHATFRYPYPCNTLKSCIDRIFVIVDSTCDIWPEFHRRADDLNLRVSRWETRQVVWNAFPSIPLSSRVTRDMYKASVRTREHFNRRLRFYDAHYRLWQHVVRKKWQRVLVLDVTTFPKDSLIKSLPGVLNNVDIESVARQTPWHVVQFQKQQNGTFWTNNPYLHKPVLQGLNGGMISYVLSFHGANFLLGINEIEQGLEKDVSKMDGVYLGFDGEMHYLGSGTGCLWRKFEEQRSRKRG